jgi:hypothetical protein
MPERADNPQNACWLTLQLGQFRGCGHADARPVTHSFLPEILRDGKFLEDKVISHERTRFTPLDMTVHEKTISAL